LFDDAFCVLRLSEGTVLWDANFHGLLMGYVLPCRPDTDNLPHNMVSKPHSAWLVTLKVLHFWPLLLLLFTLPTHKTGKS